MELVALPHGTEAQGLTPYEGLVARMDFEPDTLAGVERDEREEETGTPEPGASEDASDLPAEPAADDAPAGDTDEHSGESA